MKVANIFRKIFEYKVDKTQTTQQTVQVEFKRQPNKYDKMKGCVVQPNEDVPEEKPVEQQMSQPQKKLKEWNNPDHIFSKEEIHQDVYNVNAQEVEPLSSDLNFNNPDGEYMLKFLNFNSATFLNTPKENLPKGWNPDEIIEQGRSIGQNSDKMHEMGYTGKGISVAIIDSPIILHNDLKSSLVSYNKMANVKQTSPDAYYHGQAVSDIFVGDKDGVAPDANLHYYAAAGIQGNKNSQTDDRLRGLRQIIEHNSKCQPQDKIRVVSLSWGLNEGDYGYDEFKDMVKRLYEDDVFVACGGMTMINESITGADFGWNILEKKDQTKPQNDFSNYEASWCVSNNTERTLCILSGDRTVASAMSNSQYRHDSKGSTSWTAPAIAGIYTCALQCANENGIELTPKLFWEYALKTGVPVNDAEGNFAGKAIDCEALCKYIETEAQSKLRTVGSL